MATLVKTDGGITLRRGEGSRRDDWRLLGRKMVDAELLNERPERIIPSFLRKGFGEFISRGHWCTKVGEATAGAKCAW